MNEHLSDSETLDWQHMKLSSPSIIITTAGRIINNNKNGS